MEARMPHVSNGMNPRKKYNAKKIRRARRVRERITGISERPRLSVFRSNKYTSAQLIDDTKNITLATASSYEEKSKKGEKKIDGARYVGKIIAERAKRAGIERVVFDRGPYRYHGRVKALVESAREGGLQI